MEFVAEHHRDQVLFSSYCFRRTYNECDAMMLTLLTWVVCVRFLHCKVTLLTRLSMLCSLKRKSPCSIYTYKGGKFLLICVVYLHKILGICPHWRFVCSFIFFNHWFLSVWTRVFILCFIIQYHFILLLRLFQLWPEKKFLIYHRPGVVN